MGILKRNGIYPVEMSKMNGDIADLIAKINGVALTRNYASVYPPAQNATYVKATSYINEDYAPDHTTDPAKSLAGTFAGNQWLTGSQTNQRFHIDLGSAKIIKRIYYENSHVNGILVADAAKTFTLWGSNTAGAFAELTYGTDTNWTQITCSQSTLDIHSAADAADPKFILVTNSTAYRYYAFKFADTWGGGNYMGVRRIELQTIRYVSVYPPAHNDTYVKATTKAGTNNWPYFSTDPTKSLTGGWADNQWLAPQNVVSNQRFHIDLGANYLIKRILYHNSMWVAGTLTESGVKNFTLWGSADDANGATAFADLVYSHDTYWTQITTAQSTFDQHVAVDQVDPKSILLNNTNVYRYFAFKFADNWVETNWFGVRRIELQVIG